MPAIETFIGAPVCSRTVRLQTGIHRHQAVGAATHWRGGHGSGNDQLRDVAMF